MVRLPEAKPVGDRQHRDHTEAALGNVATVTLMEAQVPTLEFGAAMVAIRSSGESSVVCSQWLEHLSICGCIGDKDTGG